MKELKQRYFFTKKEFLLTSTGIRIISKAINEDLEFTIRYDELGFDIIKKREKTAFIPAVLFLLFFLLEFYLLIDAIINKESIGQIIMWTGASLFFGLLAGFAFYSNNKDIIYLTGGSKVLELLRNKPSPEIVDNFIQSVHNMMRAFYRKKYAIIDKHLPQEIQIERFRWLMELDVISQEEQEELVIQLQNSYLL